VLVVDCDVTDYAGRSVAILQGTGVLAERRGGATASERTLLTVLFTDLVGSTERAERLGDAGWRKLLEEHHATIRRQLEIFRGREVKTTGDGFLATFDSPSRAVVCARAVRDAISGLGLDVRVGIHTGECEVMGLDVGGVAVHLASRIQATAEPGEILVSQTVRDLVSGSGVRFADRGLHKLKGLDEEHRLFAVEG
jgi:class 3 adenylate cyclase